MQLNMPFTLGSIFLLLAVAEAGLQDSPTTMCPPVRGYTVTEIYSITEGDTHGILKTESSSAFGDKLYVTVQSNRTSTVYSMDADGGNATPFSVTQTRLRGLKLGNALYNNTMFSAGKKGTGMGIIQISPTGVNSVFALNGSETVELEFGPGGSYGKYMYAAVQLTDPSHGRINTEIWRIDPSGGTVGGVFAVFEFTTHGLLQSMRFSPQDSDYDQKLYVTAGDKVWAVSSDGDITQFADTEQTENLGGIDFAPGGTWCNLMYTAGRYDVETETFASMYKIFPDAQVVPIPVPELGVEGHIRNMMFGPLELGGEAIAFLATRINHTGAVYTVLPIPYDSCTCTTYPEGAMVGDLMCELENVCQSATNSTCLPPSDICMKPQADIVDDPHFHGFDGSHYDFQGIPGQVFNIISDKHFQLNARFVQSPQDGQTYMGELGFVINGSSIAHATKVLITPKEVTVNGEVLHNHDGIQKEDVKVVRQYGKTVVKAAGFTVDVQVSHSHSKETSGNYHVFSLKPHASNFTYLNMETGAQSGHMDNPHGLLGQTARFMMTNEAPNPVHVPHKNKNSKGFLEGTPTDYLVMDGIFGHDFVFNRYEETKPKEMEDKDRKFHGGKLRNSLNHRRVASADRESLSRIMEQEINGK